MPNWLTHILGINFKTTILGIGVIFAAVGRVLIAYRSKDFVGLANDGQLIMETIAALLAGFGLVKAKDQNVTGTGTGARSIDSTGVITNREGTVVGQQRPPDAGKV